MVGTEMPGLNHSTRVGSNEYGSIMWLATGQLRTPSSKLEKSHWKINYTVITEYVILAPNQHFILEFHHCHAQLPGNDFQTQVRELWDRCQIIDLINFQSNLTTQFNIAERSLDSRLTYSLITYR